MKKIILFVALATLGTSLNSCSSDDSGSSTSSNRISATIDGTVKTFDKVNVIVDESFAPDILLHVSATKGNDLTESITFTTWKGSVGPNRTTAFYYTLNDVSFMGGSELNTTIVTNGEDRHLTGTFSGKVKTAGGTSSEKTITSGSFDIKY